MSNHLGQIYSTTKNAEKYIVLNSQNVELSGNVKLTNGNLEVSNNLIFNTFSVGDKINFKETNNTTAYNILHDNLTSNNDASFNNIDISGNLNINGGLAIDNSFGSDGQFLMSKGDGAVPVWTSDVDTALNTKVNNDQATVRINEALYISDNNTNNSFLLMYNSNRTLVVQGLGYNNGQVVAGSFVATSDDRIKSRTTDISNATETLLKLKPIKYEKHIDLRVPEGVEDADLSGVDHHTEMGFNSQDIQKIPELEFIVNKNEKTDLLSINYIQLIALLTKSIQEQNERIKKLEEK